jgi:hypothetical protein
MSENITFSGICSRYWKYIVLSLIISCMLVPIIDSVVIQRDRNRNMVYGELFWQEGLGVYDISDKDLNETYNAPPDHMLTGVLNITYEYPIITLLFFAGLAAIEPGIYGPHHLLANYVLLLLHHLNMILFLYIGRKYVDESWFKQISVLYFIMGLASSITFAKIEPLVDLFLLSSTILLKDGKYWRANLMLGLAVQTKIHPVMFLPFFIAASPISSLAFFGFMIITMVPFLVSGIFYDSLVAHILNSPHYAKFISNPFYIGLIELNPFSVITTIVLLSAFIYSIFEINGNRFIPLPTSRLRVKEWRNIILFGLPLILMFFSWVLVWYYSWFIIPILYFEKKEDMSKYRIMILAIWIAHFLGILINIQYFLEGPITEFLAHLQI